jgi:hypothetical protein
VTLVAALLRREETKDMIRSARRSIKDRLTAIYWVIVGILGIGRPIVDRRSMFGDDPKNDPYSLEYDSSRGP